MACKLSRNDPDEHGPAETIVLDEDSVMDTREFRKLIALDPDLFEEVEAPNLED